MSPPLAITDTELWRDLLEAPDSIADTLDSSEGLAELLALLGRPTTRRVVVTGNGASWYVANAFALGALGMATPCDVVAVPAGVLVAGRFQWRPGDLILGFSSSGELRDLVEVMSQRPDLTLGLVTAVADSSLGAHASARALVTVLRQRAITHTQAYLGAGAVALELLGRWASHPEARRVAATAAEALAAGLTDAPAWAREIADDLCVKRSALVFGRGEAWVAALEAALLLKEISGIPAEGMEVREAATTGMYPLNADDLVLSLPLGDDSVVREAETVCARRGAAVRRAPWQNQTSDAAALFGHFAHPLALSIELAIRRGREPDDPGWWADYEATARQAAPNDEAPDS